MNTESQKAQAFTGRLLQNPALNGFSLLQQEEQIIQFLHGNAAHLAPTLSSEQFFPGKNWNQIFSLLVNALYQVINERLLPDLRQLATERLDYTFLQFIRENSVDSRQVGEEIYRFMAGMLAKPEVRRAFTGSYTAIVSEIAERYLEEIFYRKSYIHFELTKVQRLRMGKDEVANFVLLNLLLKPAIFLFSSSGQAGFERASGMVQSQVAEKVLGPLKKELKSIPEAALASVVHANVSFQENRFIEATARLSAIFGARCRNYQAGITVDRGAESSDKSWLSTARRNHKFYGFDVKMLDELYKIAAENVW